MGKERLDKILASQNLGSRKEVGALIRAGRVSVGGTEVRRPEWKADPEADVIAVDSQVLNFKRHVYLMMNKPDGVLSASRDPRARTVVDLLPPGLRRRGLFPAGRLDKDTRGLLILTDDGGFAHRMLSPKSHVTKWYEAVLESPVSEADVLRFRRGVALADGTVCLSAGLSVLREGETPLVLAGLREGKFHQVKRMFLACGNRVLSLRRVRIGGLALDPELAEGAARELEAEEAALVFRTAPWIK
ncbi:rRNA pseudouridine synthase [Caproiciproducens sp. NJN-50]|uniref:pseudouridine synthase n=1 Tax=Acutalibacteraceae TaxID=3082771 RepID=UPI000FFE253B|nr:MULTISPECIES: pseudouridine synthase [Acutalibacteraceae]QAT48421.1 rRNA pseudouridine synthase [Caproiciproducens sp. NJN-50]